jgi:hypothetical protein
VRGFDCAQDRVRGGQRDHVRELPQVFAVAARWNSSRYRRGLSARRGAGCLRANLSANFVLVNQTNGSASFWTNLITTLGTLGTGSSHVIRTVALGVVCLAGLGAITAAAKKSAPPPSPEVIMPVVAGNKTDRLPLVINQDTPTTTERVDVVYVQPSEEGQSGLPPPAPKEAAIPAHRDITPRHWHDPHDVKTKAANKRASITKQSKKGAADKPPKQVSDVKPCRSDGLDPLLRKLNLSPPCDS